MPSQVTNYKCPSCGGPLRFDPGSGKLQCDYCGSSFEAAEIEKLYADKDEKAAAAAGSGWDTSELQKWGDEEKDIRMYNCPSCGAELIYDAAAAASKCPYCDNPILVPGQFSGGLKPDWIIPFKIDKAAAEKALRQHYKGKYFLPRSFKNGNHIREIQGVYVPFWLFDGTAKGELLYEGTKVRQYRNGNYEITETQYFDITRSGNLSFEKIPVNASLRMDDAFMDSIEPYDYKELRDYSNAYLPGYLADRYDVGAEESRDRADKRCENSLDAAMKKTIKGYSSIVEKGGSISLERGKVHYALLPVWVLHTKWNGKMYTFMMNGQSGKVTGDLPVSTGAFWSTFALIASVLTGILSLITFT